MSNEIQDLQNKLLVIDEMKLSLSIELLDVITQGLTVKLEGYHDSYHSNTFGKRIQIIIEEGFRNLLFDCTKFFETDLSFFDQLGFVEKSLQNVDGWFSMFGFTGKMREIVDLMGITKRIHHFDSEILSIVVD